MLFKVLGSALILISSTLIGLLMAGKYKTRVKQLKQIQNHFQMIETEIFYTATPIIEVIEKISRQSKQPFSNIYGEIVKNLKKKEGKSLGIIWENAFERQKSYTQFVKEDLEVIYFFGNLLGTSDRQSQIKNVKLVQNQLKKLEEYAEKNWIKNEKLFRNLGILSGISIIIMSI